MMHIGIISMHVDMADGVHLINAVKTLDVDYTVYDINDICKQNINLSQLIRNSPIQYWIFSGSRASVHDADSPQVPMDVLHIQDKHMFLICYSMESVLYQMDYPVVKRTIDKRELFKLYVHRDAIVLSGREELFNDVDMPAEMWRNHHFYTPSASIDRRLYTVASYNDELMMAYKGDVIMTQFHPERTPAGIQMMKNWLKGVSHSATHLP